MEKIIVDTELIERVREFATGKPFGQIRKHFYPISESTLWNIMRKNGIEWEREAKFPVKSLTTERRLNKRTVKEGYFNEHERDNWLI